MLKNSLIILSLVFSSFLTGCATVPLAPVEEDTARKTFSSPPLGITGLYIFRNSTLGGALKKSIYIDGELIGESAPMTYFYKEISPGEHNLSTESEFSNNDLIVTTEGGQNYFVRHYIKMGLFVGGANLEIVSEEEGMQGVLECKLAQ
jgi:hypothetical protein